MYKLHDMGNVQFVKSSDSQAGEAELVNLLSTTLKEGRVLWLLSGGSNVDIQCRIMRQLDDNLTKKLFIMLVDERFGPTGHSDSTYFQLTKAGFDPKRAAFPPVLQDLGPQATLKDYLAKFSRLSSDAVVIGQFGIGDDGHIAGILPNSPAADSKELACYYETPTFNRITLTFEGLKAVNKIRVFCFGDSKRPALEHLESGDGDLKEWPSLILNQLDDVKVYNDQI